VSGLHVVHVVCSEAFAGVERYVLETSREMRAQGCRVTVVGCGRESVGIPLQRDGVDWLPGARPADAFRALRRIEDIDVIDTHMTKADFVGASVGFVRRIPVVSTRHFAAPRGRGGVNGALGGMLRGAFTRQIAISRFVAEHIEGPSTIVHNGVADVPNVDDAAREPFVLVLQRLEAEKRTDVALRAWASAEIPEPWRLVVAGQGSESSRLRQLARELGVAASVDFVGFRSDVSSLLSRASALVASPPLEPLGLSVLEAMAHGLPVVAAGGGGHVETVGGVDGAALFPPDDVAAAARALTELIGDARRRRDYGARLRERQRASFSLPAQTTATLEVLGAAARRRTTAP
jgi:glycosyltransferase involved in cell wall biosynthesis